jgi:hypothetical protein
VTKRGPMPGVDQTVELQEFCALGHSQVIMPTANSSASEEVVTAALLVIGGKILSGRAKYRGISVGGYRLIASPSALIRADPPHWQVNPEAHPLFAESAEYDARRPAETRWVRCPRGHSSPANSLEIVSEFGAR